MKKMILSLLGVLLLSSSVISQWEQRTNGLPTTWGNGYCLDAVDSNIAVISFILPVFSPRPIYKTSNAGLDWFELIHHSLNLETIVDIEIVDNSHIWFVTDLGKIKHSSDGGVNWTEQFANNTFTGFMNYIEMFDTSNGIAMGDALSTQGPAVFLMTTDGGENWISVNDSAFGGYSGDTWRRLDFVDMNIGYFFESGVNPQNLMKTTDGCNSWQAVTDSYFQILKFYDENIGLGKGKVCAGVCTEYIYRTFDGGANWKDFVISSGWGNDIEFVPGDPSRVWFTDNQKLFFSTDTGRTWTEELISGTSQGGRDIVFTDENHGWMLCDDGKVFYNSNGGALTSVDENDNKSTDFVLYQNYPNPFNPVTKIQYDIPLLRGLPAGEEGDARGGLVTIKVYDLLGREVAVLVNESKPPGNYEVQFDGSSLSSGVYFYTFQAGDIIGVKKMLLLR